MKERLGVNKAIFGRKLKVSLKWCDIEQNLQQCVKYKLVHFPAIGDILDDVT